MRTRGNKQSADDLWLTSGAALTPRLVAKAVCPDGQPSVTLWDPAFAGFGLRVYSTGHRAFIYQYRPRASRRTVRMTIAPVVLADGAPPASDQLRRARAKAFEYQAEVAEGGDPKARLEQATAPGGDSWALALADYAAHHRRAARRAESTIRQLEKVFGLRPETQGGQIDPAAAVLAATPPDLVTKGQLLRRLDRIAAERGPVAANRRQAYARAFLRWLEERERIPVNILLRTRRVAVENPPRDRVLNDGELARVMRATGEGGALAGSHFAAIVRQLLFTGQRLREIAELSWTEVDRQGQALLLPSERVKNKHGHRVPLSPQAWAELEARPVDGFYVYPGRGGGHAFAQFRHWKGKLDATIRIQAWRLHDLRRTYATGLYRLGCSRELVEAALNHRSGVLSGVAGVYARHDYQDEIRAASAQWAEQLLTLERGSGTVTTMGVKHDDRQIRRAAG